MSKLINCSLIYASNIAKVRGMELQVVGDFNYPDILWTTTGGSTKKRVTKASIKFLESVNTAALAQHVTTPTFGHNTLDLVLTDCPSRVRIINIGPPLGSSNKNTFHCTLSWKFLFRT